MRLVVEVFELLQRQVIAKTLVLLVEKAEEISRSIMEGKPLQEQRENISWRTSSTVANLLLTGPGTGVPPYPSKHDQFLVGG